MPEANLIPIPGCDTGLQKDFFGNTQVFVTVPKYEPTVQKYHTYQDYICKNMQYED